MVKKKRKVDWKFIGLLPLAIIGIIFVFVIMGASGTFRIYSGGQV